MEFEKKLIVQGLQESKVNYLLKAWRKIPMKSSDGSKVARCKGNELFIRAKHDSTIHEKIWKFYSESIALAPLESEELALAYGNRSALLMHMGKDSDCLLDINRALKITCQSRLKMKLLTRKIACLDAVEDKIQSLEQLQALGTDIHNDEKMYQQFLQKAKFYIYEKNFENIEKPLRGNESSLNIKRVNPFKNVKVKYNEKYGRHLVATRDISPGEIVLCSKPTVSAVNIQNSHAFCGHCLQLSFATIPCDYCTWSMYCSEQCKNEAWKSYHDMECNVVPYILFRQVCDYWKQLALKILILAIKESGGIKHLKQWIEDAINYKNQKVLKKRINSLKNLLTLSSEVDEQHLFAHLDSAVLTLISLAKSGKIFGDETFLTNTDLLNNNDVLFVGSILLKLCTIGDINGICVMDGSSPCRYSRSTEECDFERCCERGICLSFLHDLLNSSCFPNVRRCFTKDMKLVIYALRPIRKDSQLFDSYVGNFFNKPKEERQISLKVSYNFTCDCEACEEDWPDIMSMTREKYLQVFKPSNRRLEDKLYFKNKKLMDIFSGDVSVNLHNYTVETLRNLSVDIEKAMANLKQPSYTTISLIVCLWSIFDYLYGIKLIVPNVCKKTP